jgi:signal transduction histidine kinase
MIGDLMLFACPPRPVPGLLNLAEIVPSVANSLADKLDAAGCTLELDLADQTEIWADRNQLEIVIAGLVQNSIEASAPGGVIRVATHSATDARGQTAVLTVIDFGCGIDEAARQHLFDPFYSGRPAGRGLGFGLSKCWRIVTNHGGTISVASVPGGATTFEVSWPAHPATG